MWFKRQRKVKIYPMGDGRWTASTSVNQTAVWKTRPTAVEALEALRIYLTEQQLFGRAEIKVNW
jgi:hypothetical protein